MEYCAAIKKDDIYLHLLIIIIKPSESYDPIYLNAFCYVSLCVCCITKYI